MYPNNVKNLYCMQFKELCNLVQMGLIGTKKNWFQINLIKFWINRIKIKSSS